VVLGFGSVVILKLKFMRNFRDLEVWQSSVLFVKKYIYTTRFQRRKNMDWYLKLIDVQFQFRQT
jgi:hypothetical protein